MIAQTLHFVFSTFHYLMDVACTHPFLVLFACIGAWRTLVK